MLRNHYTNTVGFTRMLLGYLVYSIATQTCDYEGCRCYPKVHTTVFVDDGGQDIVGSLEDITEPFLDATQRWAEAAKELRLSIADKSTIVCSSPALAQLAQKQLVDIGVKVAISDNVRDLGLMYTVGCRRRPQMVIKRLLKAHRRITNIVKLAKITRRARKLVPTGAIPLAVWGGRGCGSATN